MITNTQRPKFLNLFKIHLPVTGVTSFAHRVSGAILFLSLPFLVYLFSLSLQDPQSFQIAQEYLTIAWIKFILLLPLWSTIHHLFAGIRFLLLDIEIGSSLQVARRTAWLVNFAGLVVFVTIALWLVL